MSSSTRSSKRATRTQARAAAASDVPPLGAIAEFDLPDECLVEVLRQLELCELLCAAWVSKRWQSVAQDKSLWQKTMFTSCDANQLLRHFVPQLSTRHSDHTGKWTKCTRVVGQARPAPARVSRRGPVPLRPSRLAAPSTEHHRLHAAARALAARSADKLFPPSRAVHFLCARSSPRGASAASRERPQPSV